MPRLEFTAGEVLQAADMNTISDQTVMTFAGTAARGSAIPSPTEGMVTYRSDDDVLEVFDGSAFVGVGGGKILQVVSTTQTDTFSASVAGSGFSSNVTGLEATITPSATSSKILISVSVSGSSGTSSGMIGFRLMRDSTAVSIGNAASSRGRTTSFSGARANEGNDKAFAGTQFLDSPSSTSAITYGVQLYNMDSGTATLYLNRSSTDTDAGNIDRTTSSITVMEVAG